MFALSVGRARYARACLAAQSAARCARWARGGLQPWGARSLRSLVPRRAERGSVCAGGRVVGAAGEGRSLRRCAAPLAVRRCRAARGLGWAGQAARGGQGGAM